MAQFRYVGPDQPDTRFHDGALRPVIGAHSVQVMRANRAHPELAQGLPYTYNHAPMLCRWRGWLYLMYLTSPVHEHGGLGRAMITRSRDGYEWEFPRTLFPEIPVPPGVYRGPGAEKLPENALSVAHHRMGFFTAKNGALLAMTFHGVCPDIHKPPNSGWGMGRVVRRVREDGSLGDIHVLRVNAAAGWRPEDFPYTRFEDSADADFRDACRELLADKLARCGWWEEERLDEDFFPLKGMKAPSLCPLPDGRVAAIGKHGLTAVTGDGGVSWSPLERVEGLYTSTGKCAMARTGDGRTMIACNPSPDGQHRWPLAILTSEDGFTYQGMGCAEGELPPVRYGGMLKNLGMNYVRGIMPGNDDAPDGNTWLAFSMNKEDIWALRLPKTIETQECQSVREDFSQMTSTLPERWTVHSPLWAGVWLEDGCLVLRDADPYDCAVATRAFPMAARVRVRFTLRAEGLQNGRLFADIADARGMLACRLRLEPNGRALLRGGNGLVEVGACREGEWISVEMEADCPSQRVRASIDGVACSWQPLMMPTGMVERFTLRTKPKRATPTAEDDLRGVCPPDLENAGERAAEAVYRLGRFETEEG